MDALVTDVHVASAVAGLRGLGRAGYRAIALGDRWTAAGLWSRYAAAHALAPSAAADPTGFASAAFRLATEKGPLVVYPGGETAITALVGASSRKPPEAILPYPGTEPSALAMLRDKRELARLAAAAGLRVPDVLAQGVPGDLAIDLIPVPCVVKPVKSGGSFATARVVTSREELVSVLDAVDPTTAVLVQPWVRGPLVMLALILDRQGRTVVRFQQIGRRTWPRAAGATSLAVSEAPDDELVRRGKEMLASVGFAGLAQLDFVVSDDGPVLIDINPRFYTSLPLALASGVNLPAIWHAVAIDEPAPSQRPYRTGVTYRWLEGDLLAASRGSLRFLASRGPRPRAGAMWAADDPLPGPLLALRAAGDRIRGRALRRGDAKPGGRP